MCRYLSMPSTLAMSLNDVKYMSLDEPWWSQGLIETTSVAGKLFFVTGDISLGMLKYIHCIFANKALAETYKLGDLNQLVFDGKWTLDKLQSVAESIYVDLNANGKSDDGDVLGYAYWNFHGTDVWVTAMGEKITTYEDGKINVTLGSEKVFGALDKVIDLVYNTEGAYRFNDETHGRDEFIAGRIAIMPMMFEDCYGPLRNMEYAYSVLPYPKYDEAQQEYYTNSMDQHSVFGVPVTLPENRYEFVGILMEALNAESWKTVYPAFYDTALKNKYSEDATTAQMIDLIMGGRVYEFSFQFGEYLQSLPYMFRNQLYSGQNNLASTLQKSAKSLNKLLEKVCALYE